MEDQSIVPTRSSVFFFILRFVLVVSFISAFLLTLDVAVLFAASLGVLFYRLLARLMWPILISSTALLGMTALIFGFMGKTKPSTPNESLHVRWTLIIGLYSVAFSIVVFICLMFIFLNHLKG